jgi:hypothetical protein
MKISQIVESRPPPMGGLNARDALSAMPSSDAVILRNCLPDVGGIKVRKGFKTWASGFPTGEAISSVFSHQSPATAVPGGSFLSSPTSVPGFLFAASKDGIYDITSRGTAGAKVKTLSGQSFAGQISSLSVSNVAGSFLICCSETDGYFYFNGTSWVTPTQGLTAGQIAGVSPSLFSQVCSFKRRLWFVERNSSKAWYLDTDAITGQATMFDFGPEFSRGGHLSFLANWSIDAGEGIDDLLVAVSSTGDVVVYKGTNPASISTFGKVGTWSVGQIPVGRKCWTQFGGDLVILSAEGVYPLSYVTRGGAESLQASAKEYTSKIRSLLGADIRASFTQPGWQLLIHPGERILLSTVPNYGAERDRQYAMSTTNSAWTVFQGIPAACLGQAAGYVFAGTADGRVLLLFSGHLDNVPLADNSGSPIRAVIVPAFDYFGSPGQQKNFLMSMVTILSSSPPAVQVGLSTDFNPQPPTGTPAVSSSSSSLWGTALWGSATWAGSIRSYASWVTTGGVGFSASLSVVISSTSDTTVSSLSYMLEKGGAL